MKSIKLKTINSKIKEIKIVSKKLNKYIAAIDYFDKTLIFFICNKWWNIYYFFYEYYWNSKCKL